MSKIQLVVEELSEAEKEALVMAFLEARGGAGITEGEAERIVDWAANAILDVMLLRLVLRGAIGIDIREGEIVFTNRGEILPTGAA